MNKLSTLVIFLLAAALANVVGGQVQLIVHQTEPIYEYVSNTVIEDGEYVVAASRSNQQLPRPGKIDLIDVQRNKIVTVFSSDNDLDKLVIQLSNSPYFAVSNQNNLDKFNHTIQVYSVFHNNSTPLWSTLTTMLGPMIIAKNRPVLVTTVSDVNGSSFVMWYNVKTGEKLGSWQVPISFGQFGESRISDDGTVFAFYLNIDLFVLNISTNTPQILLAYHNSSFPVTSLLLSPSGRTLFLSSYASYKLFTYSQGWFYPTWHVSFPSFRYIYSPTGAASDSHVVLGSTRNLGSDSIINVWSVSSPTPMYNHSIDAEVSQIRMSNDGKMFGASIMDNHSEVMIINVNGGSFWRYKTPGPMYSIDVVSAPGDQYLMSVCGQLSPTFGGGDLYVGRFTKFGNQLN